MKYLHPVFEHPVENLIWIANERSDPHARPLSDWRGSHGTLSNMHNQRSNAHFDCEDYPLAVCAAIGRDFAKIV
jgi:hypothetical protein